MVNRVTTRAVCHFCRRDDDHVTMERYDDYSLCRNCTDSATSLPSLSESTPIKSSMYGAVSQDRTYYNSVPPNEAQNENRAEEMLANLAEKESDILEVIVEVGNHNEWKSLDHNAAEWCGEHGWIKQRAACFQREGQRLYACLIRIPVPKPLNTPITEIAPFTTLSMRRVTLYADFYAPKARLLIDSYIQWRSLRPSIERIWLIDADGYSGHSKLNTRVTSQGLNYLHWLYHPSCPSLLAVLRFGKVIIRSWLTEMGEEKPEIVEEMQRLLDVVEIAVDNVSNLYRRIPQVNFVRGMMAPCEVLEVYQACDKAIAVTGLVLPHLGLQDWESTRHDQRWAEFDDETLEAEHSHSCDYSSDSENSVNGPESEAGIRSSPPPDVAQFLIDAAESTHERLIHGPESEAGIRSSPPPDVAQFLIDAAESTHERLIHGPESEVRAEYRVDQLAAEDVDSEEGGEAHRHDTLNDRVRAYHLQIEYPDARHIRGATFVRESIDRALNEGRLLERWIQRHHEPTVEVDHDDEQEDEWEDDLAEGVAGVEMGAVNVWNQADLRRLLMGEGQEDFLAWVRSTMELRFGDALQWDDERVQCMKDSGDWLFEGGGDLLDQVTLAWRLLGTLWEFCDRWATLCIIFLESWLILCVTFRIWTGGRCHVFGTILKSPTGRRNPLKQSNGHIWHGSNMLHGYQSPTWRSLAENGLEGLHPERANVIPESWGANMLRHDYSVDEFGQLLDILLQDGFQHFDTVAMSSPNEDFVAWWAAEGRSSAEDKVKAVWNNQDRLFQEFPYLFRDH